MFLFCHLHEVTAYAGLAEILEHFPWHTPGQIDQAKVRVNIDMTNVPGIQPGLVGNGTDNIGRFDLMIMSHLDTEPFHALGWFGLRFGLRFVRLLVAPFLVLTRFIAFPVRFWFCLGLAMGPGGLLFIRLQ